MPSIRAILVAATLVIAIPALSAQDVEEKDTTAPTPLMIAISLQTPGRWWGSINLGRSSYVDPYFDTDTRSLGLTRRGSRWDLSLRFNDSQGGVVHEQGLRVTGTRRGGQMAGWWLRQSISGKLTRGEVLGQSYDEHTLGFGMGAVRPIDPLILSWWTHVDWSEQRGASGVSRHHGGSLRLAASFYAGPRITIDTYLRTSRTWYDGKPNLLQHRFGWGVTARDARKRGYLSVSASVNPRYDTYFIGLTLARLLSTPKEQQVTVTTPP